MNSCSHPFPPNWSTEFKKGCLWKYQTFCLIHYHQLNTASENHADSCKSKHCKDQALWNGYNPLQYIWQWYPTQSHAALQIFWGTNSESFKHHIIVSQAAGQTMIASSASLANWSTIDLNIWNDAFPDHNMTYGSSSTQSLPRSWYNTQRHMNNLSRRAPLSQQRICLDWNNDPTLTAHTPSVNMTICATDVPIIPRLLIITTKQCSALTNAKGFNVNP